MRITKNSFVLTAAFAGLIGGTAARAARTAPAGFNSPAAGFSSEAGMADKKEIEKHACKGLNSCKGNGGGTKKEWGKNSCKGKGGCATDGSKPMPGKKS
jgi:hypothetical protein